MEKKRRRGRPKGTQIDDGRYLDKVADLMIKEPGLKKTPAINRVVLQDFHDHEHSKVQRRLLRKWNETCDERLAAARERRAETRSESMYERIGQRNDAFAGTNIGIVVQQLHDSLGPTGLQAIQSQMEVVRRLHDSLGPTGLQAIQSQMEVVRRLHDSLGSTGLQAIQSQMEVVRRLQDSLGPTRLQAI